VQSYGYRVRFIGSSIILKMSPGVINFRDSHFDLESQQGMVLFRLYTDIEFITLGASITSANDYSAYHELDIAVVEAQVSGRPHYRQIALGVECKSSAVFAKTIVKEVLGLRRELGLLHDPPLRSILSEFAPSGHYVDVRAFPPSEYWLAFVAPNGLAYQTSPRAFGIRFHQWQP
jgi:hypothetical protein